MGHRPDWVWPELNERIGGFVLFVDVLCPSFPVPRGSHFSLFLFNTALNIKEFPREKNPSTLPTLGLNLKVVDAIEIYNLEVPTKARYLFPATRSRVNALSIIHTSGNLTPRDKLGVGDFSPRWGRKLFFCRMGSISPLLTLSEYVGRERPEVARPSSASRLQNTPSPADLCAAPARCAQMVLGCLFPQTMHLMWKGIEVPLSWV